jgi:hypothetical protein
MPNPFLRSVAGVFVATADPGAGPAIAERICAVVAHAIAGKAGSELDPEWWSYAMNQLPQLAIGNATSGAVNLADPAAVARRCLAPIASSSAIKTFVDWIGGIPQLDKLNSLLVAQRPTGNIDLGLTFIGHDQSGKSTPGSFQYTMVTIDYSNPTVAVALDQLVDGVQPLGSVPYYLRI